MTATATQHLFASLGIKYSDEVEAAGWWKADPEENANALTKFLAKAFIRQAAHTKSFKQLFLANYQSDKRNKILEFQREEDKRSLAETYKKNLQYETASIRTDQKNAKKERNDFDKSLQELQKSTDEATKKKDEEAEERSGSCED